MTSDDALQDHFERLYATGGPDADIARAVLDLFDRTIDVEAELGVLEDRTPAEAVKELEQLDSLVVWAERDITFKEFGELNEETLERFVRAYEKYERIADDLRVACIEAELIAPRDEETDPIPLIRMFLPV